MSATRPLPARFSLEYEKKEAKALLERMRATDPAAQLADAHFRIARDYGFASWPKLVRYFEDAERQSYVLGMRAHGRMESFEEIAQSYLRGIAAGNRRSARHFAAYVPRFYGSIDDVLVGQPTIEEARLAVARGQGYPSWQVLREEAVAIEARIARREPPPRPDPMGVAFAAARGDLDQVIARYPDRLGEFLCGSMRMTPDAVQQLLDRGADPNHAMPNGVPVLEYALIRYWNGAAVDVLAARVKPRRALWIAAGLGDVAVVASFLDQDGKPTREAHAMRPDMVAAGFPGSPLPDASDDEILLEALAIASFNGRGKVIEYLGSRGFDVDCMLYGSPTLPIAVGNLWSVETVESLLKAGANPDLRGTHPDWTARDYAREMLQQMPDNPDRRYVAKLLGVL